MSQHAVRCVITVDGTRGRDGDSAGQDRTGARSAHDKQGNNRELGSRLVFGSQPPRVKAALHWAWHASYGFARWRYFSTFRRVMGRLPVVKVVDLLAG